MPAGSTRAMATPTSPGSANCGNCNKVCGCRRVRHGAGRDVRANRGRSKTLAGSCMSPTSAKSFGGAQALWTGFRSRLCRAKSMACSGKNGSGKSTLVKILAGFHAPDPAVIWSSTASMSHLPLKPGDFRRLGMSFVHQNLGLAPSLTVLENLRFAQLTTVTSAPSSTGAPSVARPLRRSRALA